MSIRKKFISFAAPVSGVLPSDVLCYLSGQHFILPFYHIVSDEPCPHIRHIYRFKDTKAFEKDLDFLARHYTPVDAASLPDVVAGKFRGKKIMLLTFDDGLRQMYDIVAPILLRKGIPAVFFVNTDFIDNKALMFRYKASLMINEHRAGRSVLKARTDAAVDAFMSGQDHALFDDFLKNYKPYMSTMQIKALITQGFGIGAHSCSHPYYSDLSIEEQLSETIGCMDILKMDFGIGQKLFAFPFTDHGVSQRFFDTIFDSGAVDFTFGSAGIKKDTRPAQFQRIPMEGWHAGAGQILNSEYLYYLLRAPFFKNRIKRE